MTLPPMASLNYFVQVRTVRSNATAAICEHAHPHAKSQYARLIHTFFFQVVSHCLRWL
jgi:hypothetical protein